MISNWSWFISSFALTLVVISISPIFAIVIITAVPYILHLTIPVIRASRTITITPIVIALTAIVLTGSIVPTATGWSRGSATAEGALTTSARSGLSTVTARVKPPRCRRRGTRPLSRISTHRATDDMNTHTSIFNTSSLPSRLLCIS